MASSEPAQSDREAGSCLPTNATDLRRCRSPADGAATLSWFRFGV